MNSPARNIDHTLLKPEATADQIRMLCEEAVEFGFAAVCIPPAYVSLAANRLYGSEVAVATVVGFPLGYDCPETKAYAASRAAAAGAAEIDMVIHLGAALAGDLDRVEGEIRKVVEAAPEGRVKVILECCRLTDPLKVSLTERVVRAGAAYVKTSTGFGSGGATLDDVRLLAGTAAGRIGVKAAGGIRSWEECRAFLEAGATRIGTRSGAAILEQWRRAEGV
ncbi:MAG: deoxyribose-phosphate aldolase [Desulfuromonas sp.]|uniref:deoxyribose-phosphate aldolase n=1 Tax=Desulfuromonas sp. TaxID=892 RepID=UPI000CB70051|nr:deoxyribose-phosphate aldolase [Desulfuromonas sp.]PLX81817.1 MAG: deoxyribose-phosphate aldolase [Desulfuromonas sp.]